MLICFGLSWPMNAYKSYKAKTALGTSWQFLALICAGYACGVAAKLTLGSLNWVLAVYILNCFFLAANWVVYFRNRKLDRMRQLQNAKNRNGTSPRTKATSNANAFLCLLFPHARRYEKGQACAQA